tara:strand:- start:3088 stop:3216 length:129 start_codon:yes stop_codon:yes gene_type:complete
MYGKDSWYIYKIDYDGHYDLIGPYLSEAEAVIDVKNLEREGE